MMTQSRQPIRESTNPLARGLDILLVDDDEICLFIHQRVLEQSGLCRSTHLAPNGQTALEVLKRAAVGSLPFPDIIFLDLQMPIMGGIGFLEAFRGLDIDHKERIAVVLLTSSVSEKERADAALLGARHYVSKPFTNEAWHAVVSLLYNCEEPPPTMRPLQ